MSKPQRRWGAQQSLNLLVSVVDLCRRDLALVPRCTALRHTNERGVPIRTAVNMRVGTNISASLLLSQVNLKLHTYESCSVYTLYLSFEHDRKAVAYLPEEQHCSVVSDHCSRYSTLHLIVSQETGRSDVGKYLFACPTHPTLQHTCHGAVANILKRNWSVLFELRES